MFLKMLTTKSKVNLPELHNICALSIITGKKRVPCHYRVWTPMHAIKSTNAHESARTRIHSPERGCEFTHRVRIREWKRSISVTGTFIAMTGRG